MLRFDRYLVANHRAIDLASGRLVHLEPSTPPTAKVALFQSRGDRTLIDFESVDHQRVDVWEHWVARRRPPELEALVVDFVELLECARVGAPRAFDVPPRGERHDAYVRRVLAREARVRGWVPVGLDVLAALFRQRSRPPGWMRDRSLVVFADLRGLSKDASLVLLHLARRDARPHLIVRTLSRSGTPYVLTRADATIRRS